MFAQLVSAADSAFFPLLQGLVLSLRDKASLATANVAVIDVGLEEEQRAWLQARRVRIVQPKLELPPIPPGKNGDAINYAMRLRPHIPDVVGGADLYLWIDADIWIQNERSIMTYLKAASKGGMAVTPTMHPSYPDIFVPCAHGYLKKEFTRYFEETSTHDGVDTPVINAGMFACLARAPHWKLWERALETILSKRNHFLAEQLALNYVLHRKKDVAPKVYLPARFNWQCHHALPMVDAQSGRFLEPIPPHDELEVVHLTGPRAKHGSHKLLATDGSYRVTSLRYPAQPT